MTLDLPLHFENVTIITPWESPGKVPYTCSQAPGIKCVIVNGGGVLLYGLLGNNAHLLLLSMSLFMFT